MLGRETGSKLFVQIVMWSGTGTSAPSALPLKLMAVKNLLELDKPEIEFSFFSYQ